MKCTITGLLRTSKRKKPSASAGLRPLDPRWGLRSQSPVIGSRSCARHARGSSPPPNVIPYPRPWIVGLYGVSLCLLVPSVLSIGGFDELREIRYLGTFITAGRQVRCCITHAKRSFQFPSSIKCNFWENGGST